MTCSAPSLPDPNVFARSPALKPVRHILRRELASYFATPIAYVVLVIFLLFANIFTFWMGGLFERGQADLSPFFTFMPWLYLFLIPAISMRLWAEERRNGSIELLLTQPVTLWQAVLGKFLAAWLFVAIALALTFPVWITINYLGNPDNGTIFAAYLGCLFVAGGFLAVGSFTSCLTKNQLIAFLVGMILCFLLLIVGFPPVTDWMGSWMWQWLIEGIVSLSFLTHFENITKGVLDLRDILYYLLVIVFFLLASTVVLEARKSK
jgi:ABC-2 type transport system permease protein